MPRHLIFALLFVGALIVALPPLLAGASGGTTMDPAVDLSGTQTGTLAPGHDTWYRLWDEGTDRGFGAVLQFAPANTNPNVTFNVYIQERKNIFEWQTVFVGQATDNFGKFPPGVRYWRGGSNVRRHYYLQVVNGNSEGNIDYALMATGEAFPPPTPGINPAGAGPVQTSPEGAPTPTVAATPGPAVPPVSQYFTDTTYTISTTQQIGSYTIRLWEPRGPVQKWPATKIVTIAAPGQPTEQIEMVWQIDSLTGTDITQEGYPDAIVETYSGGAHCCFSTRVYQLGPQLKKLLQTPESNCGGNFEDLDGDGVYEYSTCDDSFAYRYCSYADSYKVRAVLKYDPGAGYYAASNQYPGLFAEDIARTQPMAEGATSGGMYEWDGTSKCSVLPLVLNLLYSGQTEAAWAALDRYYPDADRDDFRAEIGAITRDSPLYPSP